MARAQATDPLHNFRFHARIDDTQGYGGNINGDRVGEYAESGFQSMTSPEATLEWVEYREGTRTYTEKYPSYPTMNDITLMRGVARADSDFYDWLRAAMEGGEYRSDLTMLHYHRAARGDARGGVAIDNGPAGLSDDEARKYILRASGPSRVKIAADMDATSGDISLAEMDVVYERFDIEVPTTA